MFREEIVQFMIYTTNASDSRVLGRKTQTVGQVPVSPLSTPTKIISVTEDLT